MGEKSRQDVPKSKMSPSAAINTTKSSSTTNSQAYLDIKRTIIGSDEGKTKTKQTVKKFLHRLKENIGIAEKTTVSKALNDALNHLDNYKLCLDNLAHAMCEVTQENPKHRTSDYLQMEIDSPPGEDQYEKVAFYLRNNKTFENYKKCKIHIEVYDKMAAEHREYVRRARCLLKNIRAFIKHDYLVIDIHRGELDQRRREMDFAKSELKAAKELQLIEVKSQQYNQAVQTFEEKLNEVTTMLDLLPKNKEAHINDLLEWTIHTRQHHEKMAKLLDLTEK